MQTSAATPSPPAEPDGAPRLATLDVLRGIAILAILFMNINGMGGSLFSLFADVRHFGWTAADQAAWWLREVLANGTARALLEMLFGAGMVILTDRAATTMGRWQVFRHYAWRNIVLFAFGLIHVFVLLWPGDILHTYALAALIAVLFRRLRPRWLFTFGLLLATLQLVGAGAYTGVRLATAGQVSALRAQQAAGQPLTAEARKTLTAEDKRVADRAKRRADNERRLAADDKARTGDARSWVGAAWDNFLFLQAMGLELLFVWEAASTMLIGAALYKLGILQGGRGRRFYQNLTAICYALGLTMRTYAGWHLTLNDAAPDFGEAVYEVARLLTTVGHIGLINLALMSVAGARLLRPFEAAGRTALTLYILQTVICLWVLYPPWGLALYGEQGWAALMLTALAVNAGLLWAANWWVGRYAIAPVEWAWRSAVARRRLPFRLRAREAGGALATA